MRIAFSICLEVNHSTSSRTSTGLPDPISSAATPPTEAPNRRRARWKQAALSVGGKLVDVLVATSPLIVGLLV